MTEYQIINDFLESLQFFHGVTKNDPNIEPMDCKNNTNGISVSVIILLIVVQDLRGFVNHSNSSANCIPHQPTREQPIH